MNNNKSDLRKKLQARIAEKKSQRTKKTSRNDDKNIITTVQQMIGDTALLVKGGVKNPAQRSMMLKKKYKWLHKQYFAIYRAIIQGDITAQNIGLLKIMLQQRERIDAKQISAKDASLQVGGVLAKKYNVDVPALEAHALKVMKEKGIPIPKEYQ